MARCSGLTIRVAFSRLPALRTGPNLTSAGGISQVSMGRSARTDTAATGDHGALP
jgi:hypothetical protein